MSRRLANHCTPLYALLLAVSGCLPIPHRHVVQAGARYRIVDQSGHPIRDATVYAYEGNIIGSWLHRRDSVRTDAMGEAELRRRRKVHLFAVLIPDGEAPSVFGWCVAAPGFAPFGRPIEDGADERIDVTLLPDDGAPRCPRTIVRRDLEQGRIAEPPA